MSSDLKYVCFSTPGDAVRHFILIDSFQSHVTAFNRLGFLLNNCSVGSTAHSAGFVTFNYCEETGKTVAEVYGRSDSLDVDSDPSMSEMFTELNQTSGLSFVTWSDSYSRASLRDKYFTAYSACIQLQSLEALFGEKLCSNGVLKASVAPSGQLEIDRVQSSLGPCDPFIVIEQELILRSLQGDRACR